MNFEKDERGLIGLYEDEYQAKVRGESFQNEKEKVVEKEILNLFKKINFCLDGMSRMHFKPRNKSAKSQQEDLTVDEMVPIGIQNYYSNDQLTHKQIQSTKK
jgi:U3 small nucleolar ribonucleoprotein component